MEIGDVSNDELWRVCDKRLSDLAHHSKRKWQGGREEQPECSTCHWFQPLLRSALDWGVCANPQSPRAGGLTFCEQGCERFEKEKEPGSADIRRKRYEFKRNIGDIIREGLFCYAQMRTARANSPESLEDSGNDGGPRPHEYKYWVLGWEDQVVRPAQLYLDYVLSQKETFDRRKAVEEVISEIKQNSGDYWRRAHESVASILRCSPCTVRADDDSHRDDEFWERVGKVIEEALEKGEGCAPEG